MSPELDAVLRGFRARLSAVTLDMPELDAFAPPEFVAAPGLPPLFARPKAPRFKLPRAWVLHALAAACAAAAALFAARAVCLRQ